MTKRFKQGDRLTNAFKKPIKQTKDGITTITFPFTEDLKTQIVEIPTQSAKMIRLQVSVKGQIFTYNIPMETIRIHILQNGNGELSNLLQQLGQIPIQMCVKTTFRCTRIGIFDQAPSKKIHILLKSKDKQELPADIEGNEIRYYASTRAFKRSLNCA